MNEYFFTQSLNIAAWLIHRGFTIQKVTKDENNISTIYFERVQEVFDAVREYNNNDELKSFIHSFKLVKQMIK